MRILKFLFGLVIALVAIFVIGGLLIPAEWSVSRSTNIHAKPERIYPLVSNFKKWKKWAPWTTSSDASLKYTYEGPKKGVGAKQIWTSEKMGNGWMQLTSADPETGIAYDLFIDMNHSQYNLQGKINFTPEGDDTKVVWTDSGNSGNSFFKRWMSVIFRPMLNKDLDAGLAGLKALAEKNNNE